jgi:hypothetical protein
VSRNLSANLIKNNLFKAELSVNSIATTARIGLDKRLIVIALIISTLAITFWTSSRVPALNDKAMME